MEVKIFPEKVNPSQLFEYFGSIESQFIMGIGNIVGWGESFVSKLKEYRI
jgi:hypothetical protein